MRAGRAHLIVPLLLCPTVSWAQELKPLEQAIIDGAEETYPLVRCAGLYLSVLEWAGEDRLGPDTSQNTKLTVANLLNLAVELREPTLGAAAEQSVMRDIRTISDAYLSRYESNYALSGEAFGQDPMWNADNDICVKLLGS
jgi:hypothetical protein